MVADSLVMRDERGLNCSFRNVSLGKLPVRALAVAPSLSPSMRISHRTHRGHAVLSVWDLLWGRRYAIGFELADADLTGSWSRLSWHSGRTLQPRSNHSLAVFRYSRDQSRAGISMYQSPIYRPILCFGISTLNAVFGARSDHLPPSALSCY